MVLRDDPSEESARQLVESLELDKLAEDRHFVLLLPNPTARGWNYDLDPEREDDLSFLVRCFAVLPKSRGGVAGFNGMIFYLATTPAASALVASLAATRPLDCAAAFVGAFPQGYQMPAGAGAPQVAWVIDGNEAACQRPGGVLRRAYAGHRAARKPGQPQRPSLRVLGPPRCP